MPLNSQAQDDAEAMAKIGDLAWAALSTTSIPNGQIAEAVGAVVQVMGTAYLEDRSRYLTQQPDPEPGTLDT